LWCPKSRWSPSLVASVALKIGKKWTRDKKVTGPEERGSFLQKQFSVKQLFLGFRNRPF
jgi:hypothetical protein